MIGPESLEVSYILPLRAHSTAHAAELAAYLHDLRSGDLDIIVVDGSEGPIFNALDALLDPCITHVPPDRDIEGANGKVRGVLSGLRRARFQKIVVADDDVRYDAGTLRAVARGLYDAAIVRPQNYFSPAPWHAVLDTSRTLINRAFEGDWPGTLAFRREFLPRGYNPDALFENLELVRTIRARGGRESVRRDLYVRRLPPTSAHYGSQRVRQAYDEFARPLRLLITCAIAPFAICSLATHRPHWVAALATASIVAAAAGYLRDGGYRYFSLLAVLAAPLWVAERAVCAWLAIYERVRYGGIRYAGRVLRRAASTRKELLRTWAV
jgi:hypothetical protein